MKKNEKGVSKKLNAFKEFNELCKKYPDDKFIGNCIFNLKTLKKGTWIFDTGYPKRSLLIGERYIVIRNDFSSAIFNDKGKA